MGEQKDNTSVYFLIYSGLLALVLILSTELHKRPRLSSILSEAALVLLVGMTVSFIIAFIFLIKQEYGSELPDDDSVAETQLAYSIVSFEPQVFFNAMLPPILFNSGYQLRRELFYRHITPIALFACLGTAISALTTGFFLYGIKLAGLMGAFKPTLIELLVFGSLLSATDTVSVLAVFQAKRVDPHLFYVVFGESALNDAVAIVLFNIFSRFLVSDAVANMTSVARLTGELVMDVSLEAIGSPVLGFVSSFTAALIFKHGDMKHNAILELSLYFLLMYFPFILAENIRLSGIVTIFFSGIFARRYIEPNVSEETKRNADVIFKLVAYLAETSIFLELGLSVFGHIGSYHWPFIAWAFLAALVSRALSIYPISFYYNWSLTEEIPSMDSLVEMSDDGCDASSHHSNPVCFRKRIIPEHRRDKKITVPMMHVMWFAGMRGAVAYACAKEFPDIHGIRDEMIASTMTIVLVMIIAMGGATGPLLEYLQIKMNVDEEEYMREWHRKRKLKGVFHEFGKNHHFEI